MQNRLKTLRQEQGLTLRELGSQVNMLSSRLSQYETGKREPKLETWQKLADFFQVPVPYLQGLTENKEEDSANTSTQNRLLKYKIVTTMTTEIQDFFTDKLIFKKLAGQQYLLAYNAETGRKVLINCKTIEFIENLSKRFEWQWVKEEDEQK